MTPTIDPATQASTALQHILIEQIQAAGGFLSFSDFMQTALYHPQYGYYTGGAHKIGAAGDFITAPTLTPLFAQTLARQLAPLLPQTEGHIYEFGAGTGALAADLLNALPDNLDITYHIIELSPELVQRQREHIGRIAPKKYHLVKWLHKLPANLNGIVIGNEVLDAMPVERIRHHNGQWQQVGLILQEQTPTIGHRPAPPFLARNAENWLPAIEGYTSELHLQQQAFLRTLGQRLRQGALIFIDYGFDAAQYYHPQRQDGTFIGHHRHQTLHDPLQHLGLADLTAHINFTALAQTASEENLDLIGYTTQAAFLLNLGLTELLEQTAPTDSPDYIRAAAACQTLLNPHEMGELFKVIAFGKHIDPDWQGFATLDLCHRL